MLRSGPICGSDDIDFSEDKSYGKCNKCNKVFPGGYDELVEFNQATIDAAVEDKKSEIQKDVEKDIQIMFETVFKGSKHVSFK